jgi:hypothetical protein
MGGRAREIVRGQKLRERSHTHQDPLSPHPTIQSRPRLSLSLPLQSLLIAKSVTARRATPLTDDDDDDLSSAQHGCRHGQFHTPVAPSGAQQCRAPVQHCPAYCQHPSSGRLSYAPPTVPGTSHRYSILTILVALGRPVYSRPRCPERYPRKCPVYPRHWRPRRHPL